MMSKISISHMSNAHNDWLRALDFYKQELNILKSRLTEVAGKNSGADVMKEVEHFENQFSIQRNMIDRLTHDIHQNVVSIGNAVLAAKAGYIDGALFEQHQQLNGKFFEEEKIINDLRAAFNVFAAKWM